MNYIGPDGILPVLEGGDDLGKLLHLHPVVFFLDRQPVRL